MGVSATGLEEQIQRLRDIAARMANLDPVLEVAAADTHALIDDAFQMSTSPSGEPWAPLTASTRRRRRRGSSKPLVDTGRLRASNSAAVDGRSIRFGTNVEYAGYHQYGTGKMQARAFLPITGGPASPELSTRGPAGAHWRRVSEMVR